MSENEKLLKTLDELEIVPGDRRVLKVLGQFIRDTRIAAGLSQEELSRKSGISRYYISSIERGAKNITILILCRLADVLSLRAWQLLQKAEEA
jgi:transcriptional regulator with XRE-family HTH domain